MQSSVSPAVELRPFRPGDGAALRALVDRACRGSRLAEPAVETVDAVLATNPELRTIIAAAAERVVGTVVLGFVAGAVGTGKVHLLAVDPDARRRGIGRRLCGAAADELSREGARLVVAEFADTAELRPVRLLLERSGWYEDGRVEDYYADGVAMVVLRYDCRAAGLSTGAGD